MMYENQFISKQQYEEALKPTSAHVLEKDANSYSMYAYPHYVEYAVKEIVQVFLGLNQLENTSENRNKMESLLRTGGYHITLAIDTEVQSIVEKSLANYKKYPSLRDPSN